MEKVKMKLIFLVGTNAELIKTAPVLNELSKRKIPHLFLHTGQHTKASREIIEVFGLKKPEHYITLRKEDLKTPFEAIKWAINCTIKGLLTKEIKKGDIIVVHGDTESTLIGTIVAKLKGCKLAHLEAGLRSFDIKNPFPEEIIRRIADRLSSYLFTGNSWASSNLKKERVKGKVINVGFNTGIDAIAHVLKKEINIKIPKRKYAILMVHRKETIYSEKELKKMIEIIEKISEKIYTVFILAKKTEYMLEKRKLLNQIKNNPNIEIRPMQRYDRFIHLLANSEFAATDGGSLQEETYFLNKPCLVLRKKTERIEGINETAFISELSIKRVNKFLKEYKSYKQKISTRADISPSEKIIKYLLNEMEK